jgi:hypothetical protein
MHWTRTGFSVHRGIEELADFRGRNDFIKGLVYLVLSHPKDCTTQVNILASSQFRMKTRSDF